MKNIQHRITNIEKNSIAEELGIEIGDILISINETFINDVFDYKYLLNDEYIEVLIQKSDGEEWLLEIEKNYSDDLGIEFENGLMDEYKSCNNKCIFCFIDQMPKGMRETLYFKDDDSRLSFLQGNYITLTNMKKEHINRIIKFHLEPINISVHTTNPELRIKMLNNKFAGESLDYLDEFYKNQISMNAQIVLCKNVNDGKELERTINDLSKYIPYLRSLSIVPVGITKYREGLYSLESFNKDDAKKVIELINEKQKIFLEKQKTHFVHASDEWYILADEDVPKANTYDGYLQLENGVGMLRLLEDEVEEALENTIIETNKPREISIATGKLVLPSLSKIIEKVTCKFSNIKVNLYGVENIYFGKNITVSGLLTGQDIINELKGKVLGECLLLPVNMFKKDELVFLDDIKLQDLEKELQIEVKVVESSGEDFLNALLGKENK